MNRQCHNWLALRPVVPQHPMAATKSRNWTRCDARDLNPQRV
jgi:hypothetical protein